MHTTSDCRLEQLTFREIMSRNARVFSSLHVLQLVVCLVER